ncbi:hypothetical protein ACFLT1_06960 [Bacteroidota bacterium]
MPNELEKYLKKIREQMDVEQPDDQGIWEGIRDGIQEPREGAGRKIIWLQIRNIAAVAILFLTIGYFINEVVSDRNNKEHVTLAAVNHQLGERENEYRAQVKYIQKKIAAFTEADNDVIEELLQEIQHLDTIYNQCMIDLKELGYDDRVVNTIFDTYERKIFLLELIILEYDKTQNYESDETLTL